LALTAALTGSAAPALAAGDYWDVDRLDWYYYRWIDNGAEAWYREATAYALDNSLILPFGRSFEGGEVLNRGQFVAILSRLEGIDRDAVEQTGQFTDVTAADYFAPAVYWASASGVVEGTSATTFHPEGTITREQVATLLARYLEEKGVILPDDAGAPARFQDTASISGWAAESVEEMRRCGLMEGDSAGRMNPTRPVTRAEGVTLFMRLTKQLQAAGAEQVRGGLDVLLGEALCLHPFPLPISLGRVPVFRGFHPGGACPLCSAQRPGALLRRTPFSPPVSLWGPRPA